MRLAWLLLLALSACYAPSAAAPEAPKPVRLRTAFDPAAVAWAQGAGENLVEGTALLRTRGGEVRTCAALDVGLIPVTLHSRERIVHIYGNTRSGFNPAGVVGRHPRFSNDDPRFYKHIRKAKCDAEGRFEFDDVPDGEWFVEAIVSWEAPLHGKQGGSLMQLVRVSDGETRRLVMTGE